MTSTFLLPRRASLRERSFLTSALVRPLGILVPRRPERQTSVALTGPRACHNAEVVARTLRPGLRVTAVRGPILLEKER